MFKLLLSFMIVLSSVDRSKGQDFEKCNFTAKVRVGKPYIVVNENFPDNYPRGKSCQWVVESDRRMRVACDPLEIPYSTGCSLAGLMIYDDTKGTIYCGNGGINYISNSTKLVFKLVAAINILPGKFSCTVVAVPSPNDDISCECGRRNSFRVVGGEETEVNEYPMMCALIDLNLRSILCGATIINNRQVLTAAHGIDNRHIQDIGVLVGAHDFSKDMEENNENLFRVESFTTHPQYNDRNQDYDIAIITIAGTMTFSRIVSPVCLPFQHKTHTFEGDIVDVLGWGSTEFAGGPSTTLRKAPLSVIKNGICLQTYRSLTTRQLCTQGGSKDSCQFDSGGPVLWQNPTTNRVIEIGIISLGSVCADGDPAVNTRVGAFIDWIMEQTPRGKIKKSHVEHMCHELM